MYVIVWVGCEPVKLVELFGRGVYSVCRREDKGRTNDARILRIGALKVCHGVSKERACTNLQILVDVSANIERHAVAVETSVAYYTVLCGIVAREAVPSLVAASTYAETVVLLPSGAINPNRSLENDKKLFLMTDLG